jgi:hypothetical protein
MNPSPTMLSPEQEHHTLLTAEKFGGSFMRHVATAGIFADNENRRRLFSAFPELVYRYGPRSHFYNEEQ